MKLVKIITWALVLISFIFIYLIFNDLLLSLMFFAILWVTLAFYFTPFYLAYKKGNLKVKKIGWLNFFFAWIPVMWGYLLAWAIYGKTR